MDFETSSEKIAILDCGSQFTHLISKKIRDAGVYSEILPPDTRASSIVGKFKGIIISGGPSSVYASDAVVVDEHIFDINIPILGICYGHQLIAQMLGGRVLKGERGEYGKSTLSINHSSKLFKDIPQESVVWMSHFDLVSMEPKQFLVSASSSECAIAALEDEARSIYSVQFHPEVNHTQFGEQIIENFLFDICAVEKTWSLDHYFEEITEETRKRVGDKNVFVLLSGGVDSMVAFVLLNTILGKQRVFGLHVDTGFMRMGESAYIVSAVKDLGYGNIEVVDASKQFFSNLEGVVDPEQKRQIIGKTFVDVFNSRVKNLYLDSHEWLLGQGTIYPDTIESGRTTHSAKIKTHHNRVAEIEKMIAEGRVVEPLEKLYKDDVRSLGEKLGIPHDLVWRHPFPGPGLAIMMLCSDTENRKTNDLLNPEEKETIRRIIANDVIDFSLIPLNSVGVQGDERTYAHPLLIEGEAKYVDLDRWATEIPNSLKKINRVIWSPHKRQNKDFFVKKTYLSKDRVALLQRVHDIVNGVLIAHDIYSEIWEMPIVLIPFSISGGESVILRPLVSENVMTVHFYRMKREILSEMTEKIVKTPGVDAVFYDITNKPPATVQWE